MVLNNLQSAQFCPIKNGNVINSIFFGHHYPGWIEKFENGYFQFSTFPGNIIIDPVFTRFTFDRIYTLNLLEATSQTESDNFLKYTHDTSSPFPSCSGSTCALQH